MYRLLRKLTRLLSVRISLMVVSAVALLLGVALFAMFRYSRQAVRTEALEKASMSLAATMQHIDNILLNVEQTAGNFYFEMLPNIDKKERMETYCRKLIETSPYVVGAAIAMKPYYYGRTDSLFMAYVHRSNGSKLYSPDDTLTVLPTYGDTAYTEQAWYADPMRLNKPLWMEPLEGSCSKGERIITFSLPIPDFRGEIVGVMGVDVSLALLTKIVMAAKPSPNSYAMLMDSHGKFIIHPDTTLLLQKTDYKVLDEMEAQTKEQADKAMMAGETGYMVFEEDASNKYVFYTPFQRSNVVGRSMEDLKWSAGLVYPEDDIFDDYNQLLYTVLMVAGGGLLLLLLLCLTITRRGLLPLRLLNSSARRIAHGHYGEIVPDSHQQDEVGQLQDHFQQMQQALAANMDEIERVTQALQAQSKTLSEAYENATEADSVKTAFLHHMTNQMMPPVATIVDSVVRLCDDGRQMEEGEVRQVVDDITSKGDMVTGMLNDLLNVSLDKELRNK